MTQGTVTNTTEFFRMRGVRSFWMIALYIVCIMLIPFLIKADYRSIDKVVDIMKTISLFYVAISGFVMVKDLSKELNIGNCDTIRWANYFIQFVTLAIAAFLFSFVLIGADAMLHPSGLEAVFSAVVVFCTEHIEYVTVVPIFLYAIANASYSFYHPRLEIRKMSWSFFTIADCPCVIPLFVVFLIQIIHGTSGLGERLFFSGAAPMLIISSNILTKIAEENV